MTFAAGLADGVTGQFFQESHIYGKNVSGHGCEERHGCAGIQARSATAASASFTLPWQTQPFALPRRSALPTHDIQPGALGKITCFGNVNAIDPRPRTVQEKQGWGRTTTRVPVHQHTRFFCERGTTGTLSRICLGAVSHCSCAERARYLCVRQWGTKVTELDEVNGTELTESGQIMVWDNDRQGIRFHGNVRDFAVGGQ
jgi:hypothetical protein